MQFNTAQVETPLLRKKNHNQQHILNYKKKQKINSKMATTKFESFVNCFRLNSGTWARQKKRPIWCIAQLTFLVSLLCLFFFYYIFRFCFGLFFVSGNGSHWMIKFHINQAENRNKLHSPCELCAVRSTRTDFKYDIKTFKITVSIEVTFDVSSIDNRSGMNIDNMLQ